MSYEDAVQWLVDNIPLNQFESYSDFYDQAEEELQTPELFQSGRFNRMLEDEIRARKPEWFEDREEIEEEETLEDFTEDEELTKEEQKELQTEEEIRQEPPKIRPTTRDVSRHDADIASDTPREKVEGAPIKPIERPKEKVSLKDRIKSIFNRLLRR